MISSGRIISQWVKLSVAVSMIAAGCKAVSSKSRPLDPGAGVQSESKGAGDLSLASLPVLEAGEKHPGIFGDGGNQNSSTVSLGSDIALTWALNMDPQVLAANCATVNTPFCMSIRMKNLMVRDGMIALLTPNMGTTDVSLVDAATGRVLRTSPSGLFSGTSGEWNPIGTEGRDTRPGHFIGFWHQNGYIYFRSAGDNSQIGRYRVSDAAFVSSGKRGASSPGVDFKPVGTAAANNSAYFHMSDSSNWYVSPKPGHAGLVTSYLTYDLNGNLERNRACGTPVITTFAKAGSFLMEGDTLYELSTTNHPVMGWMQTNPQNHFPAQAKMQWLGTRVRAHRFVGQNSDATSANFRKPYCTGEFSWSVVDSFVGHDSDIEGKIKPWAIGTNDIFIVTQSGVTHTDTWADVDFKQPLVLNAIDKVTGVHKFSKPLGITGTGRSNSFFYWFGSPASTWRPQIAHLDRSAIDGREYVGVFLPDSNDRSWHDPVDTPHQGSNARLSVVDAKTQAELWTFEYPVGETTPTWKSFANTNTKMIIAGDAVWVAWAQNVSNIPAQMTPEKFYDIRLRVDRFDLATGARKSFDFPLGVMGNTWELDDFAAVNGRLHALVTYRDRAQTSALTGGAQMLLTFATRDSSNAAPTVVNAATASAPVMDYRIANTTSLTMSANDPEGKPLTYVWNRVSGPGLVSFSANGSPEASTTTAEFAAPGSYVLEGRATDGNEAVTSRVAVQVTPPPTTVSINHTLRASTDPASVLARLVITRTGGDKTVPLDVNLQAAGTAVPGLHYEAIPTKVTMPANVTTINVVVNYMPSATREVAKTILASVAPSRSYNIRFSGPAWQKTYVTRTITIAKYVPVAP